MPKRESNLPSHIFTSYVALSSIWISHEDTNVMLFGIYGEMVTGSFKQIMIETDFETLNNLLYELGEEGEKVIDDLAKSVSHPTDENEVIFTIEEGGLHFQDHFFALMINPQEEYDYEGWDENDEDEEEDDEFEGEEWKRQAEGVSDRELKPEEEIAYVLNGYLRKKDVLPDFLDNALPTDESELIRYYNKLLAVQYQFYLHFQKANDEQAFIKSDLQTELIFVLAKANYGLVEG